MNQSFNDKCVCRTAPATPGLVNTSQMPSLSLLYHVEIDIFILLDFAMVKKQTNLVVIHKLRMHEIFFSNFFCIFMPKFYFKWSFKRGMLGIQYWIHLAFNGQTGFCLLYYLANTVNFLGALKRPKHKYFFF